jgi:putative alpha-1,2-mannosidase
VKTYNLEESNFFETSLYASHLVPKTVSEPEVGFQIAPLSASSVPKDVASLRF